MVFEVDNVTEQLIKDLQKSISDTISQLDGGQRKIEGLIEDIQIACNGLAAAEQVEGICEDIENFEKKAATQKQAEQILDRQEQNRMLVKQGLESIQATQDILKPLDGCITEKLVALQNFQQEQAANAEQHLDRTLETHTKECLLQLQSLAEKMEALRQELTDAANKTETQTAQIFSAIQQNGRITKAIAAYLQLPGYKRFFKGMEAVENEIDQ